MEEYIPSCLRELVPERHKIMYAIGIAPAGDPTGLGMINGPVEDINEMLETCGEPDAYIIRFNTDGTHDALWQWNVNRWIKTNFKQCEEV